MKQQEEISMKRISQENLSTAIEKRAREDIEACNIGGASILVAQDGNVVYKQHFSNADLPGDAVSDRTLFRLASMTKPITAVAAMILVDRGLLSPEDTVDKFYGKFSSMKLWGSDTEIPTKITVEHLLTHTSGISSRDVWSETVKQMTAENVADVESFLDFLADQPLAFIPGTEQAYSGIGSFSVLTGIIQKVTDMPFPAFLEKEIFEPCNMIDTTFEPSDEQWARLITMHNKKDGKSIVGKTYDRCVIEYFPTQNPLGGGGLISSLHDYLNFASILLCGGVFDGKRILSETAVAEISRPRVKRNTDYWGYGVRVVADEGRPLPVGTYGWSGMYGSHFWIDPGNKIIGIYMKNSRFDGGSGAKTSKNFEKDVYSCLSDE